MLGYHMQMEVTMNTVIQIGIDVINFHIILNTSYELS